MYLPDACTLYPPQHTCTNTSCLHSRTGKLLEKKEQWQAMLYTMDKGALPVHSVHLYCNECQTNYHHNFWVKDGICTYYDRIPVIIQVSKHQFAERWLVQFWITLMLVSWQDYQLCTLIQSLSLSDMVPPGNWAFGFSVTTEQVWDAFMILVPLEDHQSQYKTLAVPHMGAQKDHLTNVLHAQNLHFCLHGQPELQHCCLPRWKKSLGHSY
ncbi:hypothetical protein L208DRAFT_1330211 [Tricholoma matsutake]|nr:hypothetical protein L208DRAFT_1330211 [Tricholoma matsutake 945]